MSAAWWSWAAAAVSIIGLWVAGINPRIGWAYGIASQTVWVAYGMATEQWGMIALSFAFVVIYVRNLYRWRHTRFERSPGADAASAPGTGTAPPAEPVST
ncbi:hypothetical protein OHA46_10550 [Streptomyces sp. NBC_00708]